MNINRIVAWLTRQSDLKELQRLNRKYYGDEPHEGEQ